MGLGVDRKTAEELACETERRPLYGKTYSSPFRVYYLNPKNIFDVVEDIEKYVSKNRNNVSIKNLRPSNSVERIRIGNKLKIGAGVYEHNPQKKLNINLYFGVILRKVFLAELALEDSKLILKINEHDNLVVSPYGLRSIGNKYKL